MKTTDFANEPYVFDGPARNADIPFEPAPRLPVCNCGGFHIRTDCPIHGPDGRPVIKPRCTCAGPRGNPDCLLHGFKVSEKPVPTGEHVPAVAVAPVIEKLTDSHRQLKIAAFDLLAAAHHGLPLERRLLILAGLVGYDGFRCECELR